MSTSLSGLGRLTRAASVLASVVRPLALSSSSPTRWRAFRLPPRQSRRSPGRPTRASETHRYGERPERLRQAVEISQRDRRRGADADDQAPAGLGEPGADQLGLDRRLAPGPCRRHAWREQRRRRQAEHENATDLAKPARWRCPAVWPKQSGGYRVEIDVRARRTPVPGSRLALLAIVCLLATVALAPGSSRRRNRRRRGIRRTAARRSRRRNSVRPPRDVDLVRRSLRGRQHPARSSNAPSATGSAPSTSSPATAAASGASSRPR